MDFLYGVIGTLSVLALLCIGGGLGYALRGKVDKYRHPVVDGPGEKELDEMKQQQEAFHAVQNYTAERAYGMINEDFERGGA